MQQSIQLHIPTPCHENWDAMQPQEQGRHCNACAKTVVDFTTMSDSQVLSYLTTTKGRICGRFAQDQLNQPLTPINTGKKQAWWVMLAMPLLLLFTNKSKAQKGRVTDGSLRVIKTETKAPHIYARKPLPANLMRSEVVPAIYERKITAQVLNDSGQVIPFASISILPQATSLASNAEGRFEFTYATNKAAPELRISAINYQEKVVKLDSLKSDYLVVKMETQANKLEDVIVASGAQKIQRCHFGMGGSRIKFSRTQLIKNDTLINRIFNPAPFKVYPNPAAVGSTINIDTKKAGEYTIQLINENGAYILSKEFDAVKGNTITKFALPATLAKGAYFIVLTDEQTRKTTSTKLLVQ